MMRTRDAALGNSPITSAVRRLYEAHPYPRYPLLAKPRWQDGYASTAMFAAALYAPESCGSPRSTLIAGCGEIFPYVMRRWEPRGSRLACVDLSRQSLRRARWRLAMTFKATQFDHADLDTYLGDAAETFDHIDAYGVVHHLPDPGRTLMAMARRLKPGGTIRLMVYNSASRAWIHGVQRLLSMVGFDATKSGDVDEARRWLRQLATHAPVLRHRLAQTGAATMGNDARFADTFLHPREARLSIQRWCERIDAAGLSRVGLFDRYAELDDLDNPLWSTPGAAAMAERAEDGRFENNLELFLKKPTDAPRSPGSLGMTGTSPTLFCKSPPSSWFRYRETAALPVVTRWRLWHAFLRAVGGRPMQLTEREVASLPTAAMQRLARIGAILPSQLATPARAIAAAPLCHAMDKPDTPPKVATDDQLERLLRRLLQSRGITDERRVQSALRRVASIG